MVFSFLLAGSHVLPPNPTAAESSGESSSQDVVLRGESGLKVLPELEETWGSKYHPKPCIENCFLERLYGTND